MIKRKWVLLSLTVLFTHFLRGKQLSGDVIRTKFLLHFMNCFMQGLEPIIPKELIFLGV